MISLIENIFLDLNIKDLTREKLLEANYYIDFLIDNETDLNKAVAFNSIKLKIVRRLMDLDRSEII